VVAKPNKQLYEVSKKEEEGTLKHQKTHANVPVSMTTKIYTLHSTILEQKTRKMLRDRILHSYL